jgi:hypothetical protein
MPLLPLLAVTAIASGSIASERESLDFTLKRIRAERVQIVNGRWRGSNVPIPRFAGKLAVRSRGGEPRSQRHAGKSIARVRFLDVSSCKRLPLDQELHIRRQGAIASD